MRPLRDLDQVTLDGCCDHRVMLADEALRGDLGEAVQQLEREPGNGLVVGGVQLPPALAEPD